MDEAIIKFRTDQLEAHFDPTNARRVMEWLIAAENRRPVVLIGAGFSRNAKHRHRQGYARSGEVPLWWDLAKQMADHLQVDVSKYDAPTMADMYASSFGDAELRDLLRNALLDEDLLPGRAHRALADYRLAAVVTTNFLDTLLDAANHARWNRVIADADLAASAKDRAEHVDLIYFHGHRCTSDTWVMTRSQYEDVPRKKPVMVARVRQLMAQHPLLIVGFGMSDPNFHNLYRQLSGDMRYSQPLGLSVQLTDVSEAERRHWDELGIRTAVPKNSHVLHDDAAASNGFFEWFFQQVATSWSPDEDMVLDWACKPADVRERLLRIDSLLPHEWQERNHERHRDLREHRFAAWEKVLFSVLNEDEKAAAVRTAQQENTAEYEARMQRFRKLPTVTGEASKVPASTTRQPDEEFKRETFKKLPSWSELRPGDERTWQLDKVLVHASDSFDAVAEHFALGLRLDLFRVRAAERGSLPWIPLTFWLAIRSHARSKDDLEKLARDCVAASQKFGDEAWASRIEGEAEAQGISILKIVAENTSEKMRSSEYRAFQAMLNGNHVEASEQYREAAERAREEMADFKEWAWRKGELGALVASTDLLMRESVTVTAQTEEDLDSRKHALRDRIAHLVETRTVRTWLNQANQRLVNALKHVLEQRDASASYRNVGGSGHNFSTSPYLAWRSFRELEDIFAPPFLQQEHLEPLLWDGGFSLERELGYRMLFDRKRTRDWLRRLLDSPCATLKKQAERDAELMDSFWRATAENHTKTEQYGQLSIVRALGHAMRVADIQRLADWLPQIRGALGAEVTTYNSRSVLGREYADGLRTLAEYGTCAQARALMDQWKVGARRPAAREFARAFLGFPWTRWALTEPLDVASWLKAIADAGIQTWFLREGETKTESASIGMEDELLVFGVYQMIEAVRQSNPALITQELRTALQKLANELRGVRLREDGGWEVRRGGYLLEQALRSGSASEAERYERWTSRDGLGAIDEYDYRELCWSVIADALPEPEVDPRDATLLLPLAALWEQIEPSIAWQPLERRYTQNPHLAQPLIRFLVTCLLSLPAARVLAAERLVVLLARAPTELAHTASALTPSAWGEAWTAFVDRVLASAGGDVASTVADPFDNASGAPTRHQLGALGLWVEHLRRRRRGIVTSDDPSIQTLLLSLRSAALLALSDERTLLANHAAYAIVSAAEIATESSEVEMLAQSLLRVGDDTRITVRMAAAYAGGRLARLARSDRIREVALQLGTRLEGDENALVSLQRKLGELEGLHEQAEAGSVAS